MTKEMTSMTQRKDLRTEDGLRAVESMYGITFTDQERMLLLADPGLLHGLDKERAYVLKLALEPLRCPACLAVVCQRSCDPDYSTDGHTQDDAHHCPRCHARLTYRLGLIGGDQWFDLTPGQFIPARRICAPPEGKPGRRS